MDKLNPAVIWRKFLEQIEPQTNVWVAKRKETENIDDFLARCRFQVQKCKFRDICETEEWIIDQIIMGTKYSDLQKQLLSKNEMSIQEVLNICRSHEASIKYMKQMGELQRKCDSEIGAIKHRPENIDNCCGLTHQNGKCPAQGSICSEEPLG